jgi:hypothetical protein
MPRFVLDGFQDVPEFIKIGKCLFLSNTYFLHDADKIPGMPVVSPVNVDNIALHPSSLLNDFPLERPLFRGIFIFLPIPYHLVGHRLVTDSGSEKIILWEFGKRKTIKAGGSR